MEAGERTSGAEFVLLGDQPYAGKGDPLGFEGISEDLASLILRSRGSTPFTLGIEAPWGMGKSSLMGHLCRRLEEEKGVTPVMFNAWTADDGAVLEGLVKTVLARLDPNILRRTLRNQRLMSWLRVSGVLVASLLGIGSVVNAIWSKAASDPKARNELRQLVEQAIASWRDSQPDLGTGRMLCVFIDDLDRCSPEGVLEVFEAMKLYLDVPGVVFVVGYDQDIVSELILKRKGYGDRVKSRDYLEKFIQIVYRIPRSDPDCSEALIDGLLRSSRTDSLFGENERRLVVDGSQVNPRRIKRFLNGFVLAYGLDEGWREFEPQTLVRIQLLHMYFPEFARMLERPAARDPVDEFLSYKVVRDGLRRGSSKVLPEVRTLLEAYELAPPSEVEEGDLGVLLRRLEENVPEDFPRLAGREDFVLLVTEIAGSPDWARLREALAEGVLPDLEYDSDDQTTAAEGERGTRFEGLRVFWIDDEMERNRSIENQLLHEGAKIITSPNPRIPLNAVFYPEEYDVIVSDITRDKDEEAGLREIEELFDAAENNVPVIFFTSRITSSRRERAERLGAQIVTGTGELLELLERIARETRVTRWEVSEDPASQTSD